MMRHIGKIFCLHSFQTVKVNRFVEKKVEQKKMTIFLSYLISSHSPWSFVRKNKLILMKSNYCFDQLVNNDYTTMCVTQLSKPLLLLRAVVTLIVDTWYSVFDVIAVSFEGLSIKSLL